MSGGSGSVRPATSADILRIHGRPPSGRVQAIVVEDGDGRMLGLGGVEHQPAGLKAFMDVAPGVEPRAHRRALLRGARAVLSIAAGGGRPVFAVRDADVAGSDGFLKHLGFAPITEADEQEIWRWEMQRFHC